MLIEHSQKVAVTGLLGLCIKTSLTANQTKMGQSSSLHQQVGWSNKHRLIVLVGQTFKKKKHTWENQTDLATVLGSQTMSTRWPFFSEIDLRNNNPNSTRTQW